MRLDLALADERLLQPGGATRVVDARIVHDRAVTSKSDHAPITLEIKIADHKHRAASA